MDPSTWVNLCRWIMGIGGVLLAILGAFVVPYLTSKIDAKKDEKIKQLEIASKQALSGISSAYNYDGTKRISVAPGNFSLSEGEKLVFGKTTRLIKERNFIELVSICEKQIKKTPDWLTPYLFVGTAYAELGKREKAVENLEYVLENAHGNPDYEWGKDVLQKLKESK